MRSLRQTEGLNPASIQGMASLRHGGQRSSLYLRQHKRQIQWVVQGSNWEDLGRLRSALSPVCTRSVVS